MILSSCVRIHNTGSLFRGKATGFASIWLKFWCTGESSAYVLSCVMTDPVQHTCQSHMAMRQWRWCRVLRSESETQIAFLRQGCSSCWFTVDVPVRCRMLDRYHYDWSITAYLPIQGAIKTVMVILNPCVRICDMGWILCPKVIAFSSQWLKFQYTGEFWACCYEGFSPAYLSIPSGNKDSLDNIDYQCQTIEPRLSYPWQCHSICQHTMEVWAHPHSVSQRVG